jgi:hypothetical protein
MSVVTAVHASGAFIDYYLEPYGQLILWPGQEDPLSLLEADKGLAAVEIIDHLGAHGDCSALMLTNRLLKDVVVPYLPQGPGCFTGVGLQNRNNRGVIGIFGYTDAGAINAACAGEWSPYQRSAFSLGAVLDGDNRWVRIVGRSATTTPFGRLPMFIDGLAIFAQAYPSSLAGVNLNALPFADGYLGISTAGEARTVVALANANLTDATVMVTGLGADGATTGSGTLLIAAATHRILDVQDLLGDADLAHTTHIRLTSDLNISGMEIVTTDGRSEVLPVLQSQ